MSHPPRVTVGVPVLNEEADLRSCLEAIAGQTYAHIVEVLVVDGGSTDRTVEVAASMPGVSVLRNPHKIQAAALNIALDAAKGDVFVRVDGHTIIADDYVERCVETLARTGAGLVGGAMNPVSRSRRQEGIARAMRSRVGVGPARFHSSRTAAWTDTVYLGAFWVDEARESGGYDAAKVTNEDAELAFRLGKRGGVWFDPSIRSRYHPRTDLSGIALQFFRYGYGRARTVRKHPTSLAPRQVVAPLLVVSLISPWRRLAAGAYLTVLLASAATTCADDPAAAPMFTLSLPTMHLSWGAGFIAGLLAPESRAGAGGTSSCSGLH